MSSTPFEFQREDIRRIHLEFDGRSIIGSEVGLGKTFTALSYADRYLLDETGPIICVVPAHLKINWAREAYKHLGWHVEIISGQRVPHGRMPSEGNQVYVINYDILCPPNWRSRAPVPKDSWLHWFIQQKPRLVIFDEAHYCSNASSARTRAVRKLARRTPHVLALTGTPMANKPEGLWPILNIVRPDLYPSRQDFLEEYTYAKREWWGWVYKGARNLDRMHRELTKSLLIRRRKVDVMSQLPAVTHSIIPLEVDLHEYRQAEFDYVAWLSKTKPQMSRDVAKAEELNKLHGLKRLAGELKVKQVETWIRDFLEDTDGKLLLGAIHYRVTEPLTKAFGANCVRVDGRMTDKQKQAAFDRFNSDPDCRLCVGNIQAAGTGWSCRSTSDGALCELPWVHGDVGQFVGRLHGIQRGVEGVPVHMRYLVAVNTVEEDICSLLQVKQMWSRRAIDGLPADEDFDIYDQIRHRIQDRVK